MEKKFTEEQIKEVEKIYGKATKEEIEQAEMILNDEELLGSYYEEKRDK